MNRSNTLISRLFFIRNRFGHPFSAEKAELLNAIDIRDIRSKKLSHTIHTALLFLIAYPDNKIIYKLANQLLKKLQDHIQSNEKLKYSLYNSGLTNTTVCAAFSFEMVKWLRQTRRDEIRLNSFEADDAQIQSILSVVMPKVESEIFQDGNAEWKGWLRKLRRKDEDLLDQLIAVFDSSDLRPEVKDELWNTIGTNVEIDFTSHCSLPASLTKIHYHRSLIRKQIKKYEPVTRPLKVNLSETEAEKIIDCGRMILVRNIREIDPLSFTSAKLVSYYQLPRGLSIALMSMVKERRHPVDSYMGYVAFKNGLPVAYAGSWILFDSARIGLNVFPDYRGGESQYIFQQILQLHASVYRLKRFTVDPYQVGKDNNDGIRSGAFWVYYHAGFRPLEKEQYEIANAEAIKINAYAKYRSPAAVLKILANSRQELALQKNAVRFDATDLSRTYASILAKKYKANRNFAGKGSVKKLAGMLKIKNYREENMNFVLNNWAVLLLSDEKELRSNSLLKKILKQAFELKANGSEEVYIKFLQQSKEIKNFIVALVKRFADN